MTLPSITGYRLGALEVDLPRSCLTVGGHERSLRYQSFQVLLYLIEHPGRVVTKDELFAHVWQNASVTENALVQCVADIRRAVRGWNTDSSKTESQKNQSPEDEQLIRTVPRLGYRLLVACAPIRAAQPLTDEAEDAATHIAPSFLTSSALQPAPEKQSPDKHSPDQYTPEKYRNTPPLASFPHPSPSSLRFSSTRLGAWAIAARPVIAFGGLLLLSGSAWKYSEPHAAQHPGQQLDQHADPHAHASVLYRVALPALSNNTGRSDLNWLSEGVPQMLGADLNEVPGVELISNTASSRITGAPHPAFASFASIAQPGEADPRLLAVAGTINISANKLHLHLETRDKNGSLLATDDSSVAAEQLPAETHLLAQRIAHRLGALQPETTESPEELTTTSAEAFRYYSLGTQKARSYQTVEAIELLKKATALDPYFAMAYARIGYSYAVAHFLPAQGLPYLVRASALSAHLPEKNRLYIAAWRAIAEHRYDDAILTLTTLQQRYPYETDVVCQLSRLLRSQEKPDAAVEVLARGLRYNPNAVCLRNALGVILLAQHRYPESIAMLRTAVTLAPSDPNVHDSLGMAYQQNGQYYAAISEDTAALALNPEFDPAVIHLGDVYFQQGRYRDAVRQYRRYITLADSACARAIGYGALATVYRNMGDTADSSLAAEAERKQDPRAVWDLLQLSLMQKQWQRAAKLEAVLVQGAPTQERGASGDLRTQSYYRGMIELQHGDRQHALADFKEAVHHLSPTSGMDLHEDCLGNAYLALNMPEQAAQEFRRVLSINPAYPLAEFHLGEAYKQMRAQHESHAAYLAFLNLWQSADQDGPQIVQSRKNL